ncbi:MAG: hypothetical protein KC593_17015 [Myxococcales bacterium]|nr:hypothetical protein [Myxococcales bacterium]MCB9626660.1 hypothetical protein [Sandaracinaceae bacterium]
MARSARPHDLPDGDASVDALPDALRQAISQHWTQRVVSELQVSRTFARLGPWLRSLRADATVVDMVERAAHEEVQHAELCLHLAAVYAGERPPAPEVPFEMPVFGFEDERLEAAVHVVGLCCVNETIATAYLERCLALATTPLARAANRAHLREEIDHARLGWAHLASSSLTPDLRKQLAVCLPRILAANVPLWEQPDAHLPVDGVPAHGLPSHADSAETIRHAVRELVLPGFRHVGIVAG